MQLLDISERIHVVKFVSTDAELVRKAATSTSSVPSGMVADG